MKNITALTVLVIIISAFTANNSAYCQDLEKIKNYNLSFGTQFGFVHGQALELVYPVETKGELLSELKWDLKPVLYYGIRLDFSRVDLMKSPGFFSSLSFNIGVPADSGIMEDRDWDSTENTSLTHFSSHTNKTREFFWLDAAIGASFPIKSYLYIKPFIGGSWMHFSFTGRDGYGEYPWGPETFEGEEVIRYKQDWFLIAAGISAGTKILFPFSFDISFQISPLTYCAGRDDHLATNTTYLDFTGLGLFLEPKGSFSFSIERLELSYEFAYRYIGKTRGESYKKVKNGDYSPSYDAGAGLSLINTCFIVKVRI